jgi:formylglycine-generating enzyme required for sulfatase activity
VDTPEGRRDETTFSVTVTKSTPLRLQPIAPQTVEAGKALTFAVSVEDAKRWEGKLRFSLPSNAPAGAGIDPETGAFTLAPAANLAPGTYDLSVSVEGPENRRDQITFAVTVTRPSPAPPVTGPDYSTQGGIALDLGGGVTMELVLIRPGSFEMGSGYPRWPTFGDPYPQDEEPRHTVTITNPFYLGTYEVTQDQWKAVMGTSPSRFKRPKNPVEQVSWEDCQQFLKTMQEKLGTSAGRFRLPTEAEWEYACRAGSRTDYSFGNNEADLREHAWCVGTSLKKTNAVGQKQPNAWGLYDMHGNVWEWCADWYSRYYYGEMTNLSPTKDPSGPTRGSTRVLRGGSWNYDASNCRSARRFWGTPTLRNYACGFRVVCSR